MVDKKEQEGRRGEGGEEGVYKGDGGEWNGSSGNVEWQQQQQHKKRAVTRRQQQWWQWQWHHEKRAAAAARRRFA